ncbi:MAG: hypothetical protein ACT4O0_05185 [Pseudonocardia sp.]
MTSHHWVISAIGAGEAFAAGAADTWSDAWTCALRAAYRALLDGQLPDLQVAIDGRPEAILSPGRDSSGALDSARITAALVELHQGATAHLVADQLTASAATA